MGSCIIDQAFQPRLPEGMIRCYMSGTSLPVIWDADFLYGPRDPTGSDTYALCEINASSETGFCKPSQRTPADSSCEIYREVAVHERRIGRYLLFRAHLILLRRFQSVQFRKLNELVSRTNHATGS